MKVLVTGGAGYVGSHTCKGLAKAGFTPIAYDNMTAGSDWAVKWGPLEVGDISDRERLSSVISKYQPSAVLHFAAHAYVGESVIDPAKYYLNNVSASLNLFETLREHNIHQLVFSSSCAIYGRPTTLPINERHVKIPINPYGTSKWMSEQILQDFSSAYGMRSVSLRYFNAAGADPEGEIGECHDPETHLIPLVLAAAARRTPAVKIFGDDYQTQDGTCVRDFVHVNDLADAHVLALKALINGASTGAYNLGNGNGFSVREVINAVQSVTGLHVPFEISPRRTGDPPRLISDSSLARSSLGWVPKFSDLEEIIVTAWNWYQR